MCGTAIVCSLHVHLSGQVNTHMSTDTTKLQAVCGGTHFDSTIVIAQMKLPLLIASVHAALLLMQCACQAEGTMQPQYITSCYIIIHIGWPFMAIRT